MKKIIASDQAPKAVGPYSQAVKTGSLLFISGNLPLVPDTGNISGDSIGVQTIQVLENLKSIVEAADLGMNSVVKCTCFLKDMNDFNAFNEIYTRYFKVDPPARECVEVARLPKDVLIEVSAICTCE